MPKDEAERPKDSSRETAPAETRDARQSLQREVETTRQEGRDSTNRPGASNSQEADATKNSSRDKTDTASQHLPNIELVDNKRSTNKKEEGPGDKPANNPEHKDKRELANPQDRDSTKKNTAPGNEQDRSIKPVRAESETDQKNSSSHVDSQKLTRNENGGHTEEKFDKQGNRRELRNTDAEGKPIFEGKFGADGKLDEGKYYQNGKLTETQTRSESGGYSQEKFDEQGNRREIRNTDAEGKPVFEGKFGADGKLNEGKFYQNGKLIETQTRSENGGYSQEKFDEQGNRREIRNTDAEGKPIFEGKFGADGKLDEGKYYQNGKLTETQTRNETGGYSHEKFGEEVKPGTSPNMTEQQLKDAQVRKGEGPYQVASRLLGKDTSHTEKMALAMAFQAQYNQETNGQDPKMQNLHAGQSLLTEKNYKEVIGRIGNDSLRESINAKLDHSKEQSKPEIKPESEQPTKPADRSSKPAEQPSKPAEQPPAGETPREAGKIDRSRFEKELSDPKVMAAFAGRMHSEVGSQGKDAQLAFAEEVMNRATSRGQSLMQALSGKYYPTSRPGSSSNPSYIETINKALKEGTDTTHGATGNASGKVGFGKGGYQTVRFGGEKFGMEAVDISKGWLKKYEKLRS